MKTLESENGKDPNPRQNTLGPQYRRSGVPGTWYRTWLAEMMCLFSSWTGKGIPISSWKAASGDSVPEVRIMERAPSLDNLTKKFNFFKIFLSFLTLKNPGRIFLKICRLHFKSNEKNANFCGSCFSLFFMFTNSF